MDCFDHFQMWAVLICTLFLPRSSVEGLNFETPSLSQFIPTAGRNSAGFFVTNAPKEEPRKLDLSQFGEPVLLNGEMESPPQYIIWLHGHGSSGSIVSKSLSTNSRLRTILLNYDLFLAAKDPSAMHCRSAQLFFRLRQHGLLFLDQR